MQSTGEDAADRLTARSSCVSLTAMRVHDSCVIREGEIAELRAQVRCHAHWVWGDAPFPLWYRFPARHGHWLDPGNGDPFLAACLVPAMALGEPLEIDAPISRALWRSLPTIQSIFRCWDHRLTAVEVRVPRRNDVQSNPDPRGSTGLFFSLGVDSSYSLAKSLVVPPDDETTSDFLINVLGFDIYLWESERYPAVLSNIESLAGRLGRQVLAISTNLREFSDRMADWVSLYHGAALASTVLALRGMFRRVRIAATHTYADLSPLGSHPLLDPLWSTEELRFEHDGCEADRLEKIRRIAREPALLNVLRVCARDSEAGIYNCGACPKCLMTMIGLHVAGALDACPTLPHHIDASAVREIRIRNHTQRVYLQQLLAALTDTAAGGAIKDALEEVLGGA